MPHAQCGLHSDRSLPSPHRTRTWSLRNVQPEEICVNRARKRTVCMANQRRVARVAKQIEREVGTLLQGDQVIVNAICPEQRIGYDSALSALASVTEVQLSSDLQVAKIYLSIYSDAEGKATALKGLSKLQGYVRTRLANQMQLRMVPEIRFIHDEAAERGEEVLQLLERIRRQNAGEEEMPPVAIPQLPEDEAAADTAPAESKKSEMQTKAEDGFMDLDTIDDEDEGFLVDDFEANTLNSEYDEEDRTNQVVEEYLASIGAGGGSSTSEWADDVGSGRRGKNSGGRKKRKYRSKTR